MKEPLFIIGFMASGKTTFGRALAKSLGREFIDLDFYITQRFRRSIPEIFAERGEVAFRSIEAAMLREAGEFSDVVIACGGGTPCFHDNMAYMNSRGTTVLLEAGDERTFERLRLKPGSRPLVEGRSDDDLRRYIAEAKKDRDPYYRQAKVSISGEQLETRFQIAATVANFRTTYPDL